MSTAWFADKIEQWPTAKLVPYARNARTHSNEQVAQIAASIAEFGFTNPILAGSDGVMAASSTRPSTDSPNRSKIMRISVRIDSAAAQAQLRRWGGEFRASVQKAVSRAIASEATELRQDVRSHVAGQMKVVRKSFVKSFSAKVLDKDPKRLPALYVGSRIPWSVLASSRSTPLPTALRFIPATRISPSRTTCSHNGWGARNARRVKRRSSSR